MGGTYFPKNSKNGLPSFKEVLQKVYDSYKEQKTNIINQKDLIIKNLDLKKNSVLSQDLEPIIEASLNYLDPEKGGYKGAPKFPTFNLFETLLYFYNTTKDKKYLEPVNILIKQLCSKEFMIMLREVFLDIPLMTPGSFLTSKKCCTTILNLS